MIKLFAGTSNPILAEKVAKELKIKLSPVEIKRFDNTEVRVRVEEDVKDAICVVIQSTSNPTDQSIIELIFFVDALKRSEAKKVIAVIPYFGYARQNIQHRSGEAVSAHVVVNLLEKAGFDEIIVFDIHDEGTLGIFSVPYRHLTALPLLAQKMMKDLDGEKDDIAIVTPDQGGVERGRLFGKTFFF